MRGKPLATYGSVRAAVDLPTAPSQVIRSITTEEPVIALTFDDGPDPDFTRPKLDMLDAFGVQATFFTLGLRMEMSQKLTREIVKRGHEIGNHSFDHPDLTGVEKWEVSRHIVTTRNIQIRVTGTFWPFFRPPFGFFNKRVLGVAGKFLYPFTVLWNINPLDWMLPGTDEIVDRVLSEVRPGAIVLLHDWVGQTVDALPPILKGLKERDFRAVSINELLAIGGMAPSPPECRALFVTSPFLRGSDVAAVQTRLSSLGFNPGPLDEIYGPLTSGAVSQFQHITGLAPTGVVDRATYHALAIFCPPNERNL